MCVKREGRKSRFSGKTGSYQRAPDSDLCDVRAKALSPLLPVGALGLGTFARS